MVVAFLAKMFLFLRAAGVGNKWPGFLAALCDRNKEWPVCVCEGVSGGFLVVSFEQDISFS